MADVQPSQQSNAPPTSSQNSAKSSRSNASAKSDRSKSRTKAEMKIAAADPKAPATAPAKRSRNKPATAVVAASTTPAIAKKPRQKNAVRRNHPKYSVMLCKAIEVLKERAGSSRQAILKFIMKTYDVGEDEKKVGHRLNAALRLGLKEGTLKQMKGAGASGSFRMAAAPEKQTARLATQKSRRKSSAKTSRLKPKVMKIAKKKPSKKATKAKTSSKKTPKAKPPKKTPRAPKTATSARNSKPSKKAK